MAEESTTLDLYERSRHALNARDFAAWERFYSPDSRWNQTPMELRLYRGREAIRALGEDWLRPYETFEARTDEVLDLGNGVLFAAIRLEARLAKSSGYIQMHYGSVVVCGEGMIVQTINHPDIDEARAAAERLARSRGRR
jgi:ketosteroid isomerase-like protein